MNGKTYLMPREQALAKRQWFVIDAKDAVLGRIATRAASVLRGKHKPGFTPNVDCGDFVVVVNAKEVKLSGRKETDKIYYRHSGYPGGIRSETAAERRERRPENLIRSAVEGMLPKNRLGHSLATKLKVYSGAEHPHQSQKPQTLSIGDE